MRVAAAVLFAFFALSGCGADPEAESKPAPSPAEALRLKFNEKVDCVLWEEVRLMSASDQFGCKHQPPSDCEESYLYVYDDVSDLPLDVSFLVDQVKDEDADRLASVYVAKNWMVVTCDAEMTYAAANLGGTLQPRGRDS